MSKKYFPLPIVLLGLLSVSCNDVFDEDFYDSSSLPSLVIEAKQYLESSNVEVSLLNMDKAYHSESSPGNRSKADNTPTTDFFIDWNRYDIKQEDSLYVLYVPIHQEKGQAFSMFSNDGRANGNNHQIYSTLIVRKNSDNKGLTAIIGTYLYGRNMKEQDVKRLGIDFESSNYNGYFITSRLDGTMLAGRCIENGTTKFIFRQNPISPKERGEKADSIKTHEHKNQHLFLNLRHTAIKTKSSGNTEDFSMYFCSTCWRPWDQCTCVVIEANHMCPTCHTEIVGGLCNCYCPYCFRLKAECICSSGNTGNGGGNSGSSGGNSGGGGGGGSGGGGNSGSGNSTPSFSELPTSERVAKLTLSAPKAVDAVLAFDNEPGNPNKDKLIKERSMMCNYSVGKFYEEIYGEIPDYLKGRVYSPIRYDYKFANDWYNLLAQHTEDWTIIESNANNDTNLAAWLTAVQAKADDGYFVVGVAQGLIKDGIMGAGHIVVVIPSPDGQLVKGSWTVNTPHTIDCGKGRRLDNTDLSAGFKNQSTWKDKIRFYYHK